MRTVTLSSSGGAVTLGRESGIRLLRGVTGTGLPPVQNQWFEGAGDGANHRGGRVLPRLQTLPFKIAGASRQEVWDRYSLLARIFAPLAAPVRMTLNLDGEVWYNDFVREGGGDFNWASDTDTKTFAKTAITVKAGDPYFTREDGYSQEIRPGGLGRGLLKGDVSLSQMQLSTNNSLGVVQFNNPGDVDVFAQWTANGPFNGFTFESPKGEILQWAGTVLVGEYLIIDSELGTIVDQTGANRYDGFVGVPDFWAIPANNSVGSIELLDAEATSVVVAYWQPKKWVLF